MDARTIKMQCYREFEIKGKPKPIEVGEFVLITAKPVFFIQTIYDLNEKMLGCIFDHEIDQHFTTLKNLEE